jgi:hypothetical protein
MDRRFIVASGLVAAACVATPRADLASAVASAAGTLFEAAPVLLLTALLPRCLRDVADLAGCGCGRGSFPGALAPAAVAFCWVAFGPGPALARAAAACTAIGLGRLRGRRFTTPTASAPHQGDPADPFGELIGLAGSCIAASLVAARIAPLAHGPVLPVVTGILLGRLAPCATSGVAIAAGFAPHAPLLAATMLATNGILPHGDAHRIAGLHRRFAAFRIALAAVSRLIDAVHRPLKAPHRPFQGAADTRFAAALTACALLVLLARGPSGLLTPRLLPLVAGGAVAAIAHALRRGAGHPAALAVPAIMLGALALGSPQPRYVADETTVAVGFPGEHATFTGVVTNAANRTAPTLLVRFAITCCRIDARPVAVSLDRRLPVAAGTWIRVSGTYRSRRGRTFIVIERWQPVAPPADPFVYT